jgi:hypothetical protein
MYFFFVDNFILTCESRGILCILQPKFETFRALLVAFKLRLKNNFFSVLWVNKCEVFSHHVMKGCGGVGVILHAYLTLALGVSIKLLPPDKARVTHVCAMGQICQFNHSLSQQIPMLICDRVLKIPNRLFDQTSPQDSLCVSVQCCKDARIGKLIWSVVWYVIYQIQFLLKAHTTLCIYIILFWLCLWFIELLGCTRI